jgi:hypothetical protein
MKFFLVVYAALLGARASGSSPGTFTRKSPASAARPNNGGLNENLAP